MVSPSLFRPLSSSFPSSPPIVNWMVTAIDLPSSQEASRPQVQHHAIITVTDTGPGLSKEQLALIGSEGVQFNPTELQAGGGSGLGLWISQQIVDLHGGKLAITSPGLGLGATFQIELPLLKIETISRHPIDCQTINEEKMNTTATGPSIAPAMPQCRPKKVLLVDDTPSNRKMLGRILKMSNIPFDEAEDGEKCLTKVTSTQQPCSSLSSPPSSPDSPAPYDLILMDYEMPILNGPKATQRLRELGYGVIVIGVTGNVLPEDREYFIRHGADAVLPKPVKIQGLLDLYDKLVTERAMA
jgi:two-component system, sensor histidine kinase